MFDTAMIVDGGLGAVRGVKAINAIRIAKLERQALQVTIKQSVQTSVAESKIARNASNFREYALKDKLIQTVVKDQELMLANPLGKKVPVVGRMVDLDTGKMSQAYTNLDARPNNLVPFLEQRSVEATTKNLHHSIPGTHTEVLAADELLKARISAGETVTPATMNRFVSYQVWFYRNLGAAKMCQNCSYILPEVYSIPGKRISKTGK